MRRSTTIRLLTTVSLLGVAFVVPNPARAGAVVLHPAGDASVEEASPAVNLGAESELRVDEDPMTQVFLRFEVPALEAPVTGARLRLFVTDRSGKGPEIWRAGRAFDAGSVTWENRPALDRALARWTRLEAGTWAEADVSGAVTGPGSYTFALVPGSSDGTDFASAEASEGRPELVLETAPVSSSTTTPAVTPTTEQSLVTTEEPTPEAPGTTGTTWTTETEETTAGDPAPTTTATSIPADPVTTTSTTTSTTTTAPPSREPDLTVAGDPPTTPFLPVADASVVERSPDRAYGSEPLVLSDASPRERGLLTFALPDLPTGEYRYRLRLWAADGSKDGPKVVRTDPFDESTVTWNSAPPLGSAVADIGRVASRTWVEVDVTGAVDGGGAHSFALVPDSTDGVDFNAREASSNQPQLIVDSGSEESTTTTTTTTTTATTAPPPPPSGASFDVGLIGDTGYKAVQERALIDTQQDMNRSSLAFVMHAGDIWGGSSSCTDSRYRGVRDVFNGFDAPFFYTPGDNEWQDCQESTAGRLSKVRDMFFPDDSSLGGRTMRVQRQSSQPENARWEKGGIVFATFNEPGSTGATGSMRDRNLDWMNETFDHAERIGAAGVMVMWQDNSFRPSGGALSRELKSRTIQFRKPVVLVHGDTHNYQIDRPWSDARNFTRVEVFGTSDSGEWVRARIDPSSSGVFSFSTERP